MQLRKDAAKVRDKHRNTQAQLRTLEESYRRISDILSVRRGELQFGDVVNSMGAESAFRTFEAESAVFNKDIAQKLSEIEAFNTRLKELTNNERSKEILKTFRRAYTAALLKLNMPLLETKTTKLTSRPEVSGSGGPRSILAYYAALWWTCLGQNGSFSIPLVIDAPNQQGQDHVNLPKVLAFVADGLPRDAQIIVCSEIDTEHSYNRKIPLDRPYELLSKDKYEEVSQFVEPLAKLMHDALQRKNADDDPQTSWLM